MSDLLRKKSKQILDRGASIQPKTTFNLEEEVRESSSKQKGTSEGRETGRKKAAANSTTTVRVSTLNKDKLNALVVLGVADNVDNLVDILMDEYISSILSKDEKKQYSLILDVYNLKKNGKK
ncbi:DUF5388 domain-containing protein [Jeotgalibacillus proteolyticus]|uniref:Replication and copy control-associated protein n=1 Tax=Jeotgalibacillus proteolyticus TaxID=2082395 RepID=A0A2S5G711_9BACL|nr:DUF5388 domain-containing protein [Jeotgalibacillus proteolyticus]PPA68683.1 hypothetical protein C4B60_19110 [Jeotgalibacillus proteolyticus]PPA68760.1 hypothetical protein C4B60_19540 [Jeotgalibacillus proteolyticus]